MIRRLLAPATVLAVMLGIGIPRAFADDAPPPSYYLALGDSLAAGYQPVSPLDRDQGYVGRVYRALASQLPNTRLENLSCDGATTATLISGGGACTYPGVDSQLAAAEKFLHSHGGKTTLITIDIGGNDINHCAAGGTISTTCAADAIRTIAGNLSEILQRLEAAAPGVPIIGMTYYDPYLAAWLSGDETLASLSVLLTAQFNSTLTGVYTGAGTRVADVAGAFGTPTDPDQLVGAPPPAVVTICALTWMCKLKDIHPNDAGYQVIADAFLAEVPGYPQAAAGGLTDGSLTSVG